MSEVYQRQRRQLLDLMPRIGEQLPEAPPSSQLPPMGSAHIRSILGRAAGHNGDRCIILGWGNGQIPESAMRDPVLRSKQITIFLFDEEIGSFAQSLEAPILDAFATPTVKLAPISSESDLRRWVSQEYTNPTDIITIGSIELIDSHPIVVNAEQKRKDTSLVLRRLLEDRLNSLGNDVGDSLAGMLNACENATHLLQAPDLEDLYHSYGTAPVISIAAGPSLSDHVDALRALQNKAVLVACDAVLPGLLDAGIDPHYVTPLERLLETTTMVQRGNESQAYFAGIPVVHPQGRKPFDQRLTCIYAGDQLYTWFHQNERMRLFCGSSSGVLSASLSMYLSKGPVYFVGHDLSMEENQSHWNEAEFAGDDWAQWKQDADDDSNSSLWQGGYEDRWLPGNGGEPVHSITWWDRFRSEIIYLVDNANKTGQDIYNINAHTGIGAVIDGCKAAPLPNPDGLSDIVHPNRDARYPERLQEWKSRAAHLAQDGQNLSKHFEEMRDRIASALKEPYKSWDFAGLAKEVTLISKVSEGNKAAFAYFLRSAMYSGEIDMHLRRRQSSCQGQTAYQNITSIDRVCHSVSNALEQIQPALEEISSECSQ